MVVQQVDTMGPAVAGQAVQLECLWSRGSGPPLYSLRWCKDGDQFFVVTSVPEPRKVLFPVPGVQVLVSVWPTSDQLYCVWASYSLLSSKMVNCNL